MKKTTKKTIFYWPVLIILISFSGLASGWIFNQILIRTPEWAWMDLEIDIWFIKTTWNAAINTIINSIIAIIFIQIRGKILSPFVKKINLQLSTKDNVVYGKTEFYLSRFEMDMARFIDVRYKAYIKAGQWSKAKLSMLVMNYAEINKSDILRFAEDPAAPWIDFASFIEYARPRFEKYYF